MKSELDKQLAALVKEERFEEAAELRERTRPSRSIWDAIIRWIDSSRKRKEDVHVCDFKFTRKCYYDKDGWGGLILKDRPGIAQGTLMFFRCECGRERTERVKF